MAQKWISTSPSRHYVELKNKNTAKLSSSVVWCEGYNYVQTRFLRGCLANNVSSIFFYNANDY